ncbi:uncharacterized protein [Ptychodera flava]|uniref:uncharacterized protein n=1 Tax=Ptychodera flava TaxID=63121 RepID=UPI00396AA029
MLHAGIDEHQTNIFLTTVVLNVKGVHLKSLKKKGREVHVGRSIEKTAKYGVKQALKEKKLLLVKKIQMGYLQQLMGHGRSKAEESVIIVYQVHRSADLSRGGFTTSHAVKLNKVHR